MELLKRPERKLRLGFVPLVDCAPLVIAHEYGLYAKHGVEVELSREIGWATVRDKMAYRELDASHALAPMLVASAAGLGCAPSLNVSGLVLNCHGNAITLSEDLWNRGVRNAEDFGRVVREARDVKTYTLAVVFPYSSHHFLLRQWLKSGGIHPDRDVRIVIVPPPQMVPNLINRTIDGYCVGEPWNSLAVHASAGWCPAISRDLIPNHVEKILMVRREYADQNPERHLALITALLEACRYCQNPGNHEELSRLLAQPRYVNAPPRVIRNSLTGTFQAGHGRKFATENFHLFFDEEANRPDFRKMDWIVEEMISTGWVQDAPYLRKLACQQLFRPDLFDQAIENLPPETTTRRKHEKNKRHGAIAGSR